MNTTPPLARSRSGGFTLIELVIAVAVVGILLAVALPSFLDSMRKGRRSEAFSALAAIQLAQERWRSNQATYTATLADLNIATPTSGGNYTLAVSANTATGYEATADGTASAQRNDGQCAKLSVKVDRGAITYAGCTGSGCTLTYAATNACWSR